MIGGTDGAHNLNTAERWVSLLVNAGADQTVTLNSIAQATVTLSATAVVGSPTTYTWSDGQGSLRARRASP